MLWPTNRYEVTLVTTLKRQATNILAELHESKEPVLITEHGQPSAYLIDVKDDELIDHQYVNKQHSLVVPLFA